MPYRRSLALPRKHASHCGKDRSPKHRAPTSTPAAVLKPPTASRKLWRLSTCIVGFHANCGVAASGTLCWSCVIRHYSRCFANSLMFSFELATLSVMSTSVSCGSVEDLSVHDSKCAGRTPRTGSPLMLAKKELSIRPKDQSLTQSLMSNVQPSARGNPPRSTS